MKTIHSFCLVLATGVLLPTQAFARSDFPALIQTSLMLTQPPPSGCLLCHASSGGGGTVVQPFGIAMKAAGLNFGTDQAGMTAALNTLAANKTDSNGDGISDVDSLKSTIDPNPGGASPQYGCGGGQVASQRPVGWQATILALLTLVLFSVRKSRKI